MGRKVYAVFVAGGSGVRMGGPVPKQFMELGGIPVLRRTIERFCEAVPGLGVITVLPAAHIGWWREYCLSHSFECPQILVEGGITRFHSVRNALQKVPDDSIVMIHDGVRPFASADLIRRLLSRMDSCPAVIPVLPCTDTLKSLEKDSDGQLRSRGADPDRSRVWRAQTPQIFRSGDIRAAYGQAYDLSFTDDASVASRYGIPLSFEQGERYNIKITTPDDLPLAGFILKSL